MIKENKVEAQQFNENSSGILSDLRIVRNQLSQRYLEDEGKFWEDLNKISDRYKGRFHQKAKDAA